MNLRIPYVPLPVIFYDPALVDIEALSLERVTLIPCNADTRPVFIPPEPDYPPLASDPGPLDAHV